MEETLTYNYLIDLKKKKIDKFERAKIIQNYLDKTGKSIRGLSKTIGIPKSTIEDWLLYNRINEQQKKNQEIEGLTKTQIYRLLRNSKQKEKVDLVEEILDTCIKLLTPIIKVGNQSKETTNKIKQLRDITNRMAMYSEK